MITKILCLAIIITNEPGRCNSEMMGFLIKNSITAEGNPSAAVFDDSEPITFFEKQKRS